MNAEPGAPRELTTVPETRAKDDGINWSVTNAPASSVTLTGCARAASVTPGWNVCVGVGGYEALCANLTDIRLGSESDPYFQANATDVCVGTSNVQALCAKAIDRYGHIDVFCSNAGVISRRSEKAAEAPRSP